MTPRPTVDELEARVRRGVRGFFRDADDAEAALSDLAARAKAAEAALEWIVDWPHVKLYRGNETAYMPMIVHDRARAGLRRSTP